MASRARLRRLHDANNEMSASLDLGHRLRTAVKSARDLLTADAAAVFLPDDEGDALVIRAHDGLSESYVAGQRLPIDEVRAQVRAAGEHVILDMPSGSVGDHALIQAEGLAKLLSIPLFFQEKLTGVLVVYGKDPKRAFEPDDIELAHLLAATTAIGITNSRLYAEALAQQDLHRHLLDALGDGILIGWPNGRYEANPRAREILGVAEFDTLAELRDAVDVKDLITGGSIPPGAYPLDRAMRGETTKAEFFVTRPDTGERRDVEVTAAPVHGANGEVVAGVMTLHDITHLLASEREREQFLSIVSHELRTPLTPLKALAQLVRSPMRRARADGEGQECRDHDLRPGHRNPARRDIEARSSLCPRRRKGQQLCRDGRGPLRRAHRRRGARRIARARERWRRQRNDRQGEAAALIPARVQRGHLGGLLCGERCE